VTSLVTSSAVKFAFMDLVVSRERGHGPSITRMELYKDILMTTDLIEVEANQSGNDATLTNIFIYRTEGSRVGCFVWCVLCECAVVKAASLHGQSHGFTGVLYGRMFFPQMHVGPQCAICLCIWLPRLDSR